MGHGRPTLFDLHFGHFCKWAVCLAVVTLETIGWELDMYSLDIPPKFLRLSLDCEYVECENSSFEDFVLDCDGSVQLSGQYSSLTNIKLRQRQEILCSLECILALVMFIGST